MDTLTEHEKIRQLIAQQAQFRDDDRIDDWIEAYTDDAAFETTRGRVEGKQAIRELADSLTRGSWHGLHLLGEPVITLDGDRATATTDFIAVGRDREAGFVITTVARYRDRFVRDESGRWRYTERFVHIVPRRSGATGEDARQESRGWAD